MVNPLANLDLGKQVGGLPLGAWVGAFGVGLGVVYYRRSKAAAVVSESTDPLTDTSGVPGVGTGAVGGYVDNSTEAPSVGGITDNASWGRAATNYLIGMNYDPALADSAVRKYLLSASLSVTEYALIKAVLLKFGPPPEPLYSAPPDAPVTPVAPKPPTSVPKPVTPSPKPPAPQPVAKSTHIYYTVKSGDSLSGIAARYPDPSITWQSIYSLNRTKISNPNRIYPGTVLTIK